MTRPDDPCYRFTVDSAEEAATTIRERLGPRARVLAVRSVAPTGWRRWWGAPRLEVIARIDAPETPAPPPPAETAAPVPGTAAWVLTAPSRPPTLPVLLRRAGLSDLAIGRLQCDPAWPEWAAWPLHRALVEIGQGLQRRAGRNSGAPLQRAAFLGTPGSGRTTALCKWLGVEVFRRGRTGRVVTVEFDRPNAAGALPVFCEALGVPWARIAGGAGTPTVPSGEFLYFDLPGMSLARPEEQTPLAEFLERERIEQRILVLHAAYDHATLRAAYAAGRALGVTHLVFTHLDEVPQWGRLWDYVGDSGLAPLFLATGPSLTGDCEEDVWGAVVRRTLAGGAPGPADGSPMEPAAEPSPVHAAATRA